MAEGDFPKSPGDILYASEVNTLFYIHDAEIRQELNAKTNNLTTWNKFPDVFTDDFSDTTFVSSTTGSPAKNNFGYVFGASGTLTSTARKRYYGTINYGYLIADYQVYDIYDDFEDASVDLTKWTIFTQNTGTVTESGGQLRIEEPSAASVGTAEATTQGTGSNNLDGFETIRFSLTTSKGTSGNANCRIYATDSTTDVLLWTAPNGTNSFDFIVQWDATNQVARVWINGVLDSTVDCSTITPGTFRLLFQAKTQTDATLTASMLINELTTESTSPASTITAELAADGSTLESTTIGEDHTFTVTGDKLVTKFTVTISGSEMLYLDSYGVKTRE